MRIWVAPQFYINDELGLTLDVRRYSKGSDTYEPGPGGGTTGLDPNDLELETAQTALEVGGGVVYTTLRGVRGGPLEAWFIYRRAVSGSGGRTPMISHLEFGLRLFGGLWN